MSESRNDCGWKSRRAISALCTRFILAVSVVALLAGCAGGDSETVVPSAENHQGHGDDATADAKQAEVWTCPMHPEVKESKPGKCPICSMDLIPAGDAAEGEETDDQGQ